MYNVKYRSKYGQLVVCCDGGSWRRDYFPQYKQGRRNAKEDDPKEAAKWQEIYRILNGVRNDLCENFPYRVIQSPGAEADDIISVIVQSTREFGQYDDVMIISADHDFVQLQVFDNVEQFSTATKKLVREKDPVRFRFEQIIRGCGGDGVPNILSGDDVFLTEGARQTPVTKKLIDALWDAKQQGKLNEELDRRGLQVAWDRNNKLVDLVENTGLPTSIKDAILTQLALPTPPTSKVLNYLIKNRCRGLIPCVAEFLPLKQK
jgi:hypothetical protein